MPQATTPNALTGTVSDPMLNSGGSVGGHANNLAANFGPLQVDGPVAMRKAELEIRRPPLPHITQGFVPLSLLVGRLIQHAHNGLQDLIDNLQTPGQTDGERKLHLINYAQNIRKQFIKVLVVVIWAENAGAVNEVIDLKAWLDSRRFLIERVVWDLTQVRRNMSNARLRNPDLPTAIQVLSTGKTDTSITKQYVPPPPLSPSALLKTLRNINALLSIRLVLYEKLPFHFRDYTISSGRATFTYTDEFEIDLSIADEDPASQLHLIDLRFTFEPSVRPLPAGVFRHLEARGNAILLQKGLDGIFDFLHDYTMMNKITTLLHQAQEMLAGRWSENLKIQQIKRTLVIQYWILKGGEKSWVEIGVRRGDNNRPSRLGVRWIREGREVKDDEVPFDTTILSAETLMKTVIAMHTKHILTSIRDKLATTPLFAALGSLSLITHKSDSFESRLKVQLTSSRKCKVLIEPITGRFALQRPSQMSMQVESAMNSRPHTAHEMIIRYKFVTMQDTLKQRARSMNWEILETLAIRREELKKWFPLTTQYMTYMRKRGWSRNWLIVVTFDDTGDKWWVTEIIEATNQWNITAAERIPMKGESNVTYHFLEDLEKMGAGFITFYVNARALRQQSIQHEFRPRKAPAFSSSVLQMPDLYIRFSSLIKANWGLDLLRVSFQGVSTSDGLCTLTILGRTKEPMTQLGETNIEEADNDVSFHPQSGSYAIRFNVAVGETIIAALTEKLQRIERLIRFVAVIRKFRLNCLHVSLGRIVFRYNDSPSLSAEIKFSGDKDMTLEIPPNNPHIRLHLFLQLALNNHGLETVIKSLFATLPLLMAIERIEQGVKGDDNLHVIVRSVDWFRLDYTKLKVCLDCRLKVRQSKAYWYIVDAATVTAMPPLPGRRPSEALKKLWMDEEQCWEGLKVGAAADLNGVSALLDRAHQLLIDEGAVRS